jgi:hypothetical protein
LRKNSLSSGASISSPMELGIDSFAAVRTAEGRKTTPDMRSDAIEQLLERIELADRVGLDSFGIGEHHRPEYLDSASHLLLAAAAARTERIQLMSAVTVLSAADPVPADGHRRPDFPGPSRYRGGEGFVWRSVSVVWLRFQ